MNETIYERIVADLGVLCFVDPLPYTAALSCGSLLIGSLITWLIMRSGRSK